MKKKEKNILNKIKNSNGVTMYDLTIAFSIILLLAGLVGSTYLAIYKIQTDTKLDALATLYAVQITEYIDKISYEEVTNEIDISSIKEMFDISDAYVINITVSDYKNDIENLNIIKIVEIEVKYSFEQNEGRIVFNRLKIKEQ